MCLRRPLLQTGGAASYLVYAVGGVVVGLFSGLFGVGGGILMVPFLLLVAGYSQQQAQGLSLTAMIVTALTGAIGYFRGGTVTPAMLPVAVALAVGSIPGAAAGIRIAQKLDKTQLSALFALFIVIMAVRIMPAKRRKSAPPALSWSAPLDADPGRRADRGRRRADGASAGKAAAASTKGTSRPHVQWGRLVRVTQPREWEVCCNDPSAAVVSPRVWRGYLVKV